MVIMDAPRMKVLVPLLNKWLGGFSDDAHPTGPEKPSLVDAVKQIQCDTAAHKVDESKDDPSIVSFDPSVMNGGLPSSEEQFGQVLHTANSSVDLRYFDP